MRPANCTEKVVVGPLALAGELDVPGDATALVVFAHGVGSDRDGPHHRHVAAALGRHGLGTLRMDLWADDEADDRLLQADARLLGERLAQALDWVAHRDDLAHLRLGLFGDNIGAAAALLAATARPGRIGAVVSRGGRLELVTDSLALVHAPTLLIVGGEDRAALEHHRLALRRLVCNKRLEIVPGAHRLFDEPGALDSVAELAAQWFQTHLPA